MVLGILIGILAAAWFTGPNAAPTAGGSENNPSPDPMASVADDPSDFSAYWEFSPDIEARHQDWIDEVSAQSAADGSLVLVLIKSKYTLYLLATGVVTAEYPIELGFDPVHDKRNEGDGTTPEGIYRLTSYLDHGQTRFYRGYFIDYPNSLDRQEFAQGQQDGTIEPEATIGGDIMLHGEGSGKRPTEGGRNWTLGCIALSNADIDELWPQLRQGMQVVITRFGEI